MGLFRRRESLHEQLAREGGLDLEPVGEPRPPGWMETGIHGVPRGREWDAVVAVDARYCSVWPVGGDRPLRQFASPAQWREIVAEIKLGLNTGPLPADGAIAQLLTLGGRGVIVRWQVQLPLEVASPDQAAAALDAVLRDASTLKA